MTGPGSGPGPGPGPGVSLSEDLSNLAAQIAAIPATVASKKAAQYARKKEKMRTQYKLKRRITAVMQHGDGSESEGRGSALDLKCAALIKAASMAGPKVLKHLAPATAEAIVQINRENDDRIKSMASLLPKRSRFRASMVRQLSHNKPAQWVSHVFGVHRSYRHSKKIAASMNSPSPLQMEQMRGPKEDLSREAVTPVIKKIY